MSKTECRVYHHSPNTCFEVTRGVLCKALLESAHWRAAFSGAPRRRLRESPNAGWCFAVGCVEPQAPPSVVRHRYNVTLFVAIGNRLHPSAVVTSSDPFCFISILTEIKLYPVFSWSSIEVYLFVLKGLICLVCALNVKYCFDGTHGCIFHH